MKTSVIIPTYNGARKLPGILSSLKNQTRRPDEVLVVVDGSSDNTREVLENYKEELLSLKVIYQHNQGRAAVRNSGAQNASGDLFIFLDDDIRLLPDGIEKHLEFHKSHENCILFGRVTLDPERIKMDDFSQFRAAVENNSFLEISQNGPVRITLENYRFTTANLSCTKAIFMSLKGFDEQLTDSEDFDFSLRAITKGVPIFFLYSLLGWHDDYIPVERFINRQVQYVRSKKMLGRLKPEMKDIHPDSFEYGVESNYIKKGLRKAFVINKFWILFAKTSVFKKIVPKSLRYKIYDLVVSSSVINKVNIK
jgi:glycosyltransferase involved in cell wall biosynthesis